MGSDVDMTWSPLHSVCAQRKGLFADKRPLFCLLRYGSELKLVRLKMSEGGVYTFQASNGYASVNHTFTIFVISEYNGFF